MKLRTCQLVLGILALLSGFAFAGAAYANSQSAPAPMVLEGLGRATVPLDGLWQFRTGDEMQWASPAFDDSAWEKLQAGRPWEAQGHRNYTGFAWYRRHLILPPGTPASFNLALFIPTVDSAYEIYWNGKLIGGIGKVPPRPVWYFPGYEPNGAFTLGPAQSGVLALRVWRAPVNFGSEAEFGGMISVPLAGSAEAIQAIHVATVDADLRAFEFTATVARVSAVAGLFALLFWLRNRRQIFLLWLAIAMLFPLEMHLLFGENPVPFRLSYGLVGVVVGLNDLALWFLLITLLDLTGHAKLVQWTRILAITEITFDCLDGSLQFFDWTGRHAHLLLAADVAFTIPPVLLEFWGFVLVAAAFRKRLDGARWILAIAAVTVDALQAMQDVTELGARWTHWGFAEKLGAPLLTVRGSALDAYTIVNTLMLLSLIYVAWRYFVEQFQRQTVLEQEYHSARELQQALIPELLPSLPGYSITSAYKPALDVGGDFFQVIPLAGDATLVAIGDVSGKGLPAAMAVALILGALRSRAEITDQPAAILGSLNRRLEGRIRGGFATCLILRLDAKGNCILANAGHLPPYLNGKEFPLLPAFPLGMMPETIYEPVHLKIEPGDRLTLYTDGIVEARNSAGELFGFERLRAISTESAEEIAEAAQAFGQEDDITVLTLTLAGAPAHA